MTIIAKSLVLTFFGLIIVIPFYFMINLAGQKNAETTGNSLVWWPKELNWKANFTAAFDKGYWKALWNTIMVTSISVVGRTFFAATIGYAFSWQKWRFKTLIWWFFLSIMILPEIALLVGQYQIVVKLQWKHSNSGVIAAMILPFVSSTFSAFMYRNAFASISDRTKEAAMIDGVGTLPFFFKVAIPMVRATTLTVIILTAFAAWNSFSWPIMLTTGNTNRFFVLSTWLFNIGVEELGDIPITFNNIKMAGAILTIIPMFFVYFIFRKRIMRSISTGSAVKG